MNSGALKFSVLTPSYNTGHYLRRSIESVKRQDYKNWEHIVVDGGSSDDTLTVLNDYPHLDWISESDKGQSDAMNKAFSRASGDLIIYLNADDELADGLLARVARKFEQTQRLDMVVGNLRINNRATSEIRRPSVTLFDILDNPFFLMPANPVSYIYRRSLQERIGSFPVNNHYTMDYWFLLRAYLFGVVGYVDFVCGTFYLDGANKSSDHRRGKREMFLVRGEFLKTYFYLPRVLQFIIGAGIRKLFRKLN